MSDLVIFPISWIRTAALALAILCVAVVFGFCHRTDPSSLPTMAQAQLDRHVVASAVDTSTTHRLERDTAVAVARQRAAAVAQHRAEASAAIDRRRADSLEQVAAEALTARDSAIAYHAALDAAQASADSLLVALAQAGTQLQAAAAHQAATDSIALVWERHALRGDSLITTLVDVATHPGQCRIAWLLPCPTRRQAAVGGALVGVAATLIATGKIKLPIAARW